MHPLKLPEFEIKAQDDQVFCLIRKKWIVLTPEEWVRQHFLNLLISYLNYPKGRISLEHSLKYFRNDKRSDIVVFDQEGEVFLIVECKSYNEKLDQKTLNQIAQYNKVLNAKYLAITNGLLHFVWKKEADELIQLNDFPNYKDN